jgi:nuclear pore complex protein Nup85
LICYCFIAVFQSQDEIDTAELASMSAIRDVFHLAHIIYVPVDGRGDGIASEEVVDWLNNTSPYPSAERREQLTSMAAPYENNDFWEFIYS